MAQNITLLGASYSDVPAVLVPKTGGGTARFDDASVTTATAPDVTSGKIFLAADGTITTGTASGGASNFVTGTFTVGSTGGEVESFTIPYTGTGYPIALMIVVEGGAYNMAISPWYSSVVRYAVGQWTFSKSNMTTTPTYTTSGAANQGVTSWIFKNSTTSHTSYSRSSAMNTNVLTSSSTNATGAPATCVRFKGNGTTISYYTANGTSSTYGLLPDTTYRYFAVYSS